MAGGTFAPGEKKDLAGFYMRFVSAALAAITAGTRGVVAVAAKSDWGPVGEPIKIESETALNNEIGTNRTTGYTANLAGYLALLGGARQVIIYRVTDTTESKGVLTLSDSDDMEIIRLETKYPSSRAFSLTVRDSAADSNQTEAIFFEGSRRILTVLASKSGGIANTLVDAINNAPDNTFFDATKLADGNGTVTPGTSLPFAGGGDGVGNITNADYLTAMSKLEPEYFNAFTFDAPVAGELLQSARIWILRMRSEGRMIRGYFGGSATDDATPSTGNTRSRSLNHESIVNVITGARMADTWYDSARIAIYTAGLVEGKPLTSALTYESTPFADVTPKLSNTELREAQSAGSVSLFLDNGLVKYARGINTLTSLSADQSNTWKKIKIMRLRDSIYEDIYAVARDNYIGKVPNNDVGQAALIAAINAYFEQLRPQLLETFEIKVDTENMATADSDEFYWMYTAREVDNMEEIYGTGHVK